MVKRLAQGIGAGLITLLASPSLAAPDLDKIDLVAERTAIGQFQKIDQRLQDVGWRLARGNAPFCDRVIPSIGLQLQDLASYGAPDIARAALNMKGDFAVQTAAQGSPAALSGTFTTNREVTRINRVDPNTWTAKQRLYWQRLVRAHDRIDAILAEHGRIAIGFAGQQSQTELEPVMVCASRFVLASKTDKVRANGDRVLVGTENVAIRYSEELFAALVAHELAHNFLMHSDWLNRNSRKRANVNRTEREADRLMPWLLANAGYDPRAVTRFFETYKPSSGGVLFLPGTHSKWRDRAAAAEAELPLITELMEREGKADWSKHFRREIDPQSNAETAADQ